MSCSLTTYRVKDWSSYNQLLQDRWNINVWFAPDVIEKWYKGKDSTSHYTNHTIIICLTIRSLFNLSLRATQGFMNSLITRLNLPIKCPHYSRLSRRAQGLGKIKIPRKRGSSSFCIAIDSTGLKVYGEGEWHVRMHKASRRRTWRKLHIAMDPVTQQITSATLTSSRVHDSVPVPSLIKTIKDPIEKLFADGAYDGQSIRRLLYQRGIKQIIPPQTNAVTSPHKLTKPHLGRRRKIYEYPELQERDRAIEHMHQFTDTAEGRRDWKKSSGYHLRSLVETTMMRFKRTFTDKLRSRRIDTQQAEVYVKCTILNKMIEMGIPYTVPVQYPR